MELENIELERKGGIFYITISRESKMNALNLKTMQEIDEAFQRVYDDNDIKGVIVTGKGAKAFVAGADISELKELNYMNGRKFAERGQEIFDKIENCPKPVIAAVNGFALGGGCELSMACHMRVAAENARFGQPEVNLGIIPGYGGTQRLTMLVGKGKSFELTMTGDILTAEEAHRINLVNHVVPADELIGKCEEIMEKILAKAPLAIAQTVDCINAVFSTDDGYQTEANSFGNCCKTEDFQEGTDAFLSKRKPIFSGK